LFYLSLMSSFAKFTNGGNADIEGAMLETNFLADVIRLGAGPPGFRKVEDALGGHIDGFCRSAADLRESLN
jgi:hypothetical protein